MGLAKPDIKPTRPFQDVYQQGEPFVLDGIRLVKAKTEYGDGNMVCLKVRAHDDELTIWGTYLERQAESADAGDFGKAYVITSEVVEGFSKRPVKILKAHDTTEPPAGFGDDPEFQGV